MRFSTLAPLLFSLTDLERRIREEQTSAYCGTGPQAKEPQDMRLHAAAKYDIKFRNNAPGAFPQPSTVPVPDAVRRHLERKAYVAANSTPYNAR